MRIAILGWGSLIWSPSGLPITGVWQADGPILPIEFSRVSSDGRLTLVIDTQNGSEVTTRYALSSRNNLYEAVEDLGLREGTTIRQIGSVCVGNNELPNDPVIRIIVIWAKEVAMDAVVWTALTSNFSEMTGNVFSVENAVAYLSDLHGETRLRALEYIRHAPEEVETPVRRAVRIAFQTNH